MTEALDTVCGLPLEPGERVVFYYAADHKLAKILHIAVGVLLAVVLFGFVLIVYGILYDRWHLKFVAITDRRILVKRGDRPALWLYLSEVVELRAQREERSGGGVIGAVGAVAHLAQNKAAEEKKQTDAAYWSNATSIIVEGQNGAISIESGVDFELLGPALANAAFTSGYVARQATANHPR
jgi:hypothetical protein